MRVHHTYTNDGDRCYFSILIFFLSGSMFMLFAFFSFFVCFNLIFFFILHKANANSVPNYRVDYTKFTAIHNNTLKSENKTKNCISDDLLALRLIFSFFFFFTSLPFSVLLCAIVSSSCCCFIKFYIKIT